MRWEFAMPLEMARVMAGECTKLAQQLDQRAAGLESGKCRHFTNGADDTLAYAAELRHSARNIQATLMAFERLQAKEELKAVTSGSGTSPSDKPAPGRSPGRSALS